MILEWSHRRPRLAVHPEDHLEGFAVGGLSQATPKRARPASAFATAAVAVLESLQVTAIRFPEPYVRGLDPRYEDSL